MSATETITITVPTQTFNLIQKLSFRGVYGLNFEHVAANLVRDRLVQMIEDGTIEKIEGAIK